MSGLHRLSTDIGGVFAHRLLIYLPFPTSSSSPSLLGIERQVQSKPEALFLGHIHFAANGLKFTFLPFGAGLGITNIARMAPAHVGQAALTGGWNMAKSEDSKLVLFGHRREALEGVDTRGR